MADVEVRFMPVANRDVINENQTLLSLELMAPDRSRPCFIVVNEAGQYLGILAKKDIAVGLYVNGEKGMTAGAACNRNALVIQAPSLEDEEALRKGARLLADRPQVGYLPIISQKGRRPLGFAFRQVVAPPQTSEEDERRILAESNYGENWSDEWGGSRTKWHASILPRIADFIPTDAILEIGQGFGRWSAFLIPQCRQFFGVDLAGQRTAICRELFKNYEHAKFFTNDGLSFPMLEDKSCDFVFSFGSLIFNGFGPYELEHYVKDILRVLRPGGAAFLHHRLSDLAHPRVWPVNMPLYRSPLSAVEARQIVERAGGAPVLQEILVTHGGALECITVFTSTSSKPEFKLIKNDYFYLEAGLARAHISPYFESAQQWRAAEQERANTASPIGNPKPFLTRP
ncbi:MAG: methyltransferase domain-containing protein [Candidatus Adiutrix sp.]|jgi:SAM-dependent methyltransferase|nr:methyltransferase domain-containing protein [Candidatus Adiutrix sp.]